jgi:hypothetical protein
VSIQLISDRDVRTEKTTSIKNLQPTPVLDCDDPCIRLFAEQLQGRSPRDFLQAAHKLLIERIHPIYDLDERQPASITLKKGSGSCSQRMACLEAISRVAGVPTGVRAFHVDGRFWYPRFPLLHRFIPKRILLLWPQFFIQDGWIDFDELYGPMSQIAAASTNAFSNEGESLFEAVEHTPIDFLGKTCGLACAIREQGLSKFILADEGVFDTRDEALERFGSLQDTPRGRMFQLLLRGKSSAKG